MITSSEDFFLLSHNACTPVRQKQAMINLFFRLKIFNQSTSKMSDDEIDTEIEEGYDEFIKEYGSRYEWDNERNPDEWRYWDDLFCTIKTYWGTKAVRNWKEKALKQFVHSLPNVRNPSSLFHVFIHSDAFYLPHILSLIELPYYPHKLRWEIWPEGIEKFQCRLFIQGEESIVDYCLKAKKSNDIIKLCKGHFRSEFYSGLT